MQGTLLVWVGSDESLAAPTADLSQFLLERENCLQRYSDWRDRLCELEFSADIQALALFQQRFPHTRIVSTGYDGLLMRAGCQVLELYGNVWRCRCQLCGAESVVVSHCPRCGGPARPALVWPGEAVESWVVERLQEWLQESALWVTVNIAEADQPAFDLFRMGQRPDLTIYALGSAGLPGSLPRGGSLRQLLDELSDASF